MGAQKCVLALLTLETELWGVEFDRHGAGVRCWGRRQAELVIVAVAGGSPQLRRRAHATEACGRQHACSVQGQIRVICRGLGLFGAVRVVEM